MTTLRTTVLSLVIAAGLVLSLPVSAQTANDVRIAQLLAQIQTLQAQIAILKGGSAGVNFSINMTIGSSGTEVSRLQSFLISRGHVIPAGATGYFGAQTQAAVAAFQAKEGVSPAVGYFGPLTRAKVNALINASIPAPDEDDTEDTGDRSDARDAIEDLEDRIANAQDDIDEAEDDGEDMDEANDILDEARDLFQDAEEAFDDENYDEVMDIVRDAEDLVDDALREIDTTNGDVSSVETDAVSHSVSGDDNDYATFTIELTLSAFGEDTYIPRDGEDAFTYRIENASDGSVITGSDNESVTISSDADTEGDYFIIREDEEETFRFRVVFDPEAGDEGESYRLQLLTIGYADDTEPPTSFWSAHESNKYQTDSAYISD
jgi:peptidoglycan hydrolase-like protein with peptidoglycan-binding domain